MAKKEINWKLIAFIVLILGVSTCTAIQSINHGRHTAETGQWLITVAGLIGGVFAASRIIGKEPSIWHYIGGIVVGLSIISAAIALSFTEFAFILGLVVMVALAIIIAVYLFNEATKE